MPMTWMYVTQMCAIAGPGFFYLTPWVLFLDVSHPWTGGLGFPQLFGPHLMVLLPFSPGPEKARFPPSFGWTRPQATDYVFFSFLTRTAYDLEGTTSGGLQGGRSRPPGRKPGQGQKRLSSAHSHPRTFHWSWLMIPSVVCSDTTKSTESSGSR